MSVLLVNVDDPFFVDVAVELYRLSGLVGCIATTTPDIGPTLANVDIVDTRLLYRHSDVAGLVSSVGSETTFEFDASLIECEHYFLAASDRFMSTAESVMERRRLFRDLVRFWCGYLMKRPALTLVWFESTPHMGWDIVLFYVAKLLGRDTLILARTLISDWVYLHSDFRRQLDVVPLPANTPDLEGHIGPDLLDAVKKSSSWREHSLRVNAQAIQSTRWTALKAAVGTAISTVKSIWEPAGFVSAIAGNPPMHFLQLPWMEFKHRRHIRSLRKAYDALAVEPTLGHPYVYFAMHYQPERTSLPEALFLDDQFLMIEMLAEALPDGWKLVVKEHPRQLGVYPTALRRRHWRKALDYEQIAALSNVVLAPIETPSGQLVEDAQAVATLTGSVGWEGLLLGKPAIVAGPTWYDRCASVITVRSPSEARKAFQRIASSDPVQVGGDVLRLLAALRPMLFRSTTSHRYAKSSGLDYQVLVGNLATAIATASRQAAVTIAGRDEDR